MLKELLQRMLGRGGHGAGLHVRGQAGFNPDAVLGRSPSGLILYRFNPMADALRAQLTNGLPDTFRAGRFARVDGDMPPGVASPG